MPAVNALLIIIASTNDPFQCERRTSDDDTKQLSDTLELCWMFGEGRKVRHAWVMWMRVVNVLTFLSGISALDVAQRDTFVARHHGSRFSRAGDSESIPQYSL